jgi:hypothetical protein
MAATHTREHLGHSLTLFGIVTISTTCRSSLLTATKCMFGCPTASLIASLSLAASQSANTSP